MKGYLFIFHKNHILSSLPFLKDIFFSKVPYSFLFFFGGGGYVFFPFQVKDFVLILPLIDFYLSFPPNFSFFPFMKKFLFILAKTVEVQA